MHRNTRFLGSENMVKLSIMLARKARICREGFGQQIGHTHMVLLWPKYSYALFEWPDNCNILVNEGIWL